jgi:hypothetical protein
MGDFGAGIDVENNMLSEMSQRSNDLGQHYADQIREYNTQLRGAKGAAKAEMASQVGPQKVAEDTTQLAQVGQRAAAARGVFRNTYGSNLYKYATNLGRTGEETTLGVRPLGQAISKGVGMVRAAPKGGFTPGSVTGAATQRSLEDTPTESLLGDSPSAAASPEYTASVEGATDRFTPPASTSTEPPAQPTSAEGGSAPEGAAVSEGTAAESTSGVPAVENATTRSAASTATAAEEGANAAAEATGSTLKAGLSTAADLGAKAGVGLGIVGGGLSAAQDFSGGHFHLAGDNNAEKAGNAMSIASGALDTLGLVAPPLAILGGLVGVGSAIADIFGHHEEAKAKVASVQQTAPPPPKPVDVSVASTSVGQVASQGADTLHSIAGTTF